jgi:hypothetical protein
MSNLDDKSIKDEDGLLRRIPCNPNMFKFDQNLQEHRPTSALFKDREGGVNLSITLEEPLLREGKEHKDAISSFPNFGLARIQTDFVRNELVDPQIIFRDPTPDDPFHGLVQGKKSRSTRKALAKHAKVVISPTFKSGE